MTAVRFDPVGHRYFVGAREVPSVTRIIRDLNLRDASWDSEEARLRGTDVHVATHYLDEGALDRRTVRPEIAGYVTGYERFLVEQRPQWTSIEEVVADPSGLYAGTQDREGRVLGLVYVVDIKTGVSPTAGLQTAAYRRCRSRSTYARRASLQLFPNGSYQFVPLDGPHDERRFLAAVDLWYWRTGGLS